LPEAEKATRKAIELQPNYPNAYSTLGIILRAQQKLPEAAEAQRKAVELDHATADSNLGHLLMAQGQFAEARAAFKRHESLDPFYLGWADAWLQLDAKLPRVLTGETLPADAAELFAMADFCQLRCRQYYAASARLYREAFAANPKLVIDLRADIRYDAACAAAQAGCGKGKDAGNLESKDYTRLRGQALAWLRADLRAWGAELVNDPGTVVVGVRYEMLQWRNDPALDDVRAPDALAKLPEAERQEWRKLWEEVAELERRAAEPK
jgi:tetratricopeptide (TPR) repeat protein